MHEPHTHVGRRAILRPARRKRRPPRLGEIEVHELGSFERRNRESSVAEPESTPLGAGKSSASGVGRCEIRSAEASAHESDWAKPSSNRSYSAECRCTKRCPFKVRVCELHSK